MAEIVIMGELLVEIMRAEEDVQLYETGKYFRGPFPSPMNSSSSRNKISSRLPIQFLLNLQVRKKERFPHPTPPRRSPLRLQRMKV